MHELLRPAVDHGVLLIAGTTVLLAVGCGAVLMCRSPVHRQRIAELAIAGVLIWIALALMPLPRFSLLPLHGSLQAGRPRVATQQVATLAELHESDPPEEFADLDPILTTKPQRPLFDAQPVSPPSSAAPVAERADRQGPTTNAVAAPLPSQLSPPHELRQTIQTSRVSKSASADSLRFDPAKLPELSALAYLTGGAMWALFLLAGHILLLFIRGRGHNPPVWLASQYEQLVRPLGIAAPRLIVSRYCSRPLSWGILSPIILLPRSLCTVENRKQLTTILLHELGHVVRRDACGNALFCIALPVLYFHPLYWWLRRNALLAAELLADDWAAEQTGKASYVEDLVALARGTSRGTLTLVGATGFVSFPSMFYRRMQMLLAREIPLARRTSRRWRLTTLLALCLIVGLAASLGGVRRVSAQIESSKTAAAPAPESSSDKVEATLTPSAEGDPNAKPAEPIITTPAADTPPATLATEKPGADVAPQPGSKSIPGLGELPVLGKIFQLPPESAPAQRAEAEKLLAERRALDAQLKSLQDRLQKLGGTPPAADTAPQAGGNPPRTVQLTQVDGTGLQTKETWTVDEQGRLSKLIAKYQGRVPQQRKPEPAKSGDPVYEWVAPNPSAQGQPTYEPHEGLKRTPENVPAAPATGQGSSSIGVQQLDLVNLATSFADAVASLEAAEARHDEIEALSAAKTISQQEQTSARLALSAAKRKEQLLRRIVQVALAGTERELEHATQLYKQGYISESAAQEARTKVEILKEILGTRSAEATDLEPHNTPIGAKR